MLPIDFDPCANCLQVVFPLPYGCDDCEWMVFQRDEREDKNVLRGSESWIDDEFFDDDKEKSFENINIDGNVIETDFNHAFNEGFVDGDISPLSDYSNECHDLL